MAKKPENLYVPVDTVKPESSNFECNICLEPAKDAVISLCGHLYCWPCLYTWFLTKPYGTECPVCKNPIKKEDVIPLYGRGPAGEPHKTQDPHKQAYPPRPNRTQQRSSNTDSNSRQTDASRNSNYFDYFFSSPFNLVNGPFGSGNGGFHMSFGIGAFPIGLFTTIFNFGGTNITNRTNESTTNDDIYASTSQGYIVHHNLNNSSTFNWKAHEFDAWIVHLDVWDVNTLYSGGDDNTFKIWDLRNKAASYISHHHKMGVCSIQNSPNKSHIFITSGFDGILNFWDKRHLKIPFDNSNLDGGVWRIEWQLFNVGFNTKELILVAATHGGCYLLEYHHSMKNSLDILGNYKCGTLTYGTDWLHLPKSHHQDKDKLIIATSSFYEKRVCLLQYLY